MSFYVGNTKGSVTINGAIKNQDKTVTVNGQVSADAGYTGLGTVTVDVDTVNNTNLNVTANGTYTPTAPYTGFGSVNVAVPATFNKVLKRNSSNSFYYLGMDDSFTSYVAPAELTRAPAYTFREAFFDAKYLQSVDFSHIQKINGFAFERAFAWLESSSGPSSIRFDVEFPLVTTITCEGQFYYAFYGNKNLRKLSFPNLVSITNPRSLSQTCDNFGGQDVSISSDSGITSPFTWATMGSACEELNFPKLTTICKQCLYYSFRNSKIKTINFDSLQYANSNNAFNCAFNWPSNVENSVINLPELLEVKGHDAFDSLAVKTLNAPKLKIIGSDTPIDNVNANASHFKSSALTTINLPSLEEIWCSDSYADSGTFANSTELVSAYFPNLHTITNYTGTSSYYDYSIAAKNIFYGCSKLTEIHFCGAYEDEIKATGGFSTIWGRGAGNATIYFDLNYATINFNITNGSDTKYVIDKKEVSNPRKVLLKDHNYLISSAGKQIFGSITGLELYETRTISYDMNEIVTNTITFNTKTYTNVTLNVLDNTVVTTPSDTQNKNTSGFVLAQNIEIPYTVTRNCYEDVTGTFNYTQQDATINVEMVKKLQDIEEDKSLNLTTNGTIGSSDVAVAWERNSTTSQNSAAYKIFDGDSTTYSSFVDHFSNFTCSKPLIIYFATPICITGYTQKFYNQQFRINTQKFYGSNDGTNWTLLYEDTGSNFVLDTPTVNTVKNIPNTTDYSYYKFDDMTSPVYTSNNSYPIIYEYIFDTSITYVDSDIKEFDITCNISGAKATVGTQNLMTIGNKIGGSAYLKDGQSLVLTVSAPGYAKYKETLTGSSSTTSYSKSITLEEQREIEVNLSYSTASEYPEYTSEFIDENNFILNSSKNLISSGPASYNVNTGKSVGYIAFTTPSTETTLTLKCYVSSESSCDYGGVYLGTQKYPASNLTYSSMRNKTVYSDNGKWLYSNAGIYTSSTTVTETLNPNTTYILTFAYCKDGSRNSGDDRFYIENISFTALT